MQERLEKAIDQTDERILAIRESHDPDTDEWALARLLLLGTDADAESVGMAMVEFTKTVRAKVMEMVLSGETPPPISELIESTWVYAFCTGVNFAKLPED